MEDDYKLFAEPPPRTECAICTVMMPHQSLKSCDEIMYLPCCGQQICAACRYRLPCQSCPFCTKPAPRNHREIQELLFDRIDNNDPWAMISVGALYSSGLHGIPVDHVKSVQMYQRAADLGNSSAHYHLGLLYNTGGEGVAQQDKKKAIYHWQQAAMMEHEDARIELGIFDAKENDNPDRAMRHFIMAAKLGSDNALETVKDGYRNGIVKKDDLAIALRGWKASKDEVSDKFRDQLREAKEKARDVIEATRALGQLGI